MGADKMLLAELLATRAVMAALARELLLRNGSDAFVHAQAQAVKFAAEAASSQGAFDPEVQARAAKIVNDTFAMADGTP